MICLKLRYCKHLPSVFAIFFISGLWMLSGCSGDDATGPATTQVEKISIFPKEITLESEEQIDFSVFALTASGDTVDTDEIDVEWQWWSTDPDVFDVESGGLATGHSSGEAFCVVEATVTVSQAIAKEMDIRYAGIGFNGGKKEKQEIKSMKLLPEKPDHLEFVNFALKEKRLRFTGRDSAIVFVF